MRSSTENTSEKPQVFHATLVRELEEALLSEAPGEALQLMYRKGSLTALIPELEGCVGFMQQSRFHYEDVFSHTLRVVNNTPRDLILRYAALFHDIAKPLCFSVDDRDEGHFYNHAQTGAELTETILKRLGYNDEITESVNKLVHHHMSRLNDYTDKGLRRLINNLGEDNVKRLIQLFEADLLSHKPPQDISRLNELREQLESVMEKMADEKVEVLEKELNVKLENWKAEGANKDVYLEDIFPDSRELFLIRGRKIKAQAAYDGMIMTLGNSPEPLMLSLSLLKPQWVHVLCTKDTANSLESISKITGYSHPRITHEIIDKSNPIQIYQKVYQQWEKWKGLKSLAADITGGTKVMTSSLSMAAAILGIDLMYVDHDITKFDAGLKRPKPGSEFMRILENPYVVLGVEEEKKAIELFRRGDFDGAARLLEGEWVKSTDPHRHALTVALAKACSAWDNMKFRVASKMLVEAIKLKPFIVNPSVDFDKLEMQQGQLEHLEYLMPQKPGDSAMPLLKDRNAMVTLIMSLVHMAERRKDRGNYDTAALYLYRTLELMSQRRLARHGINTASPDYQKINAIKTLDRVNQIRGDELGHPPLEKLPDLISLQQGYILLEALGDGFCLVKTANKKGQDGISYSRLDQETKQRNYSILAHGFSEVSQEQYNEFSRTVKKLLGLFCKVETINYKEALEATALPEIS